MGAEPCGPDPRDLGALDLVVLAACRRSQGALVHHPVNPTAARRLEGSPSSESMKLRTLSLVVLLLLTGGFACRRTDGIQIEFVLPPGFAGFIILKRDAAGGVDPKWNGRTATYQVPADGRLNVKSLAPFEEWHKLVCTSADGERLHSDTDDDARSLPNGTPVLWELSTSVDGNQVRREFLFYGTFWEATEAREKVIHLR